MSFTGGVFEAAWSIGMLAPPGGRLIVSIVALAVLSPLVVVTVPLDILSAFF